jgi:putative flippase GtrA
MTLTYAAGVVQTFIFNKRWSFGAGGATSVQFRRYCLAYATGYACNLAGLFLLVDLLACPHQLAQGILILATAALLFVLQKFWVFRAVRPESTTPLSAP